MTRDKLVKGIRSIFYDLSVNRTKDSEAGPYASNPHLKASILTALAKAVGMPVRKLTALVYEDYVDGQ